MRALFSSPAITMMMMTPTMMTTTTITATTILTVVMTTTAMAMTTAMGAPWLLTKNSTVHTPAARNKAKLWCVEPAVNNILSAGNVEQLAATLRDVVNHSALTAACKLAGKDSLKEQATAKYVCEQSAWMLGHAHSSKNDVVK